MNKKAEQQTETQKKDNQEWHVLDASKQPLGRLATEAASLLLGKHRTDSAKHTVSPVTVVVINADNLKVTGKKMEQKMYRHYSGHPGGLKERSLAEQMRRDSKVVIQEAVSGMLPKNKLRTQRLKRLKVYTDDKHPHQPQTAGSSPEAKAKTS